MVRILVADDHPIVREGLQALLETQADFEVVAEAANGEEVLRLALELEPDVILLDLEMPVMDGVEATRRLHLLRPSFHIIVFTAFHNDVRIIPPLRAGAVGYLLKDASRKDIFSAIRIAREAGALLRPLHA